MKPVAEWDEDYIMSLPLGEFDWLETKGRRSLDLTIQSVAESQVLETLSKEVSAFANSGGGTLIYGLKDYKPGDAEWQVDDGGVDVAVKKNGTKEWLETVIPHQMEPELMKFNVYAINPSGPGSKIASGRALFVVEVPDSDSAPHQANDHRYYARVASRARPIGHRMIMDIANRRQHPKIELQLCLQERVLYEQPSPQEALDLLVTAENAGRVYAEYVKVVLEIPWGMFDSDYITADKYVELTNGPRKTVRLQNLRPGEARSGAGFNPILPSDTQRWSITLRDDTDLKSFQEGLLGEDFIRWTLFADHSPPASGEVQINKLPVVRSEFERVG